MSTDDDLDDFIVDDSPVSTEEKELSLADSEGDEDEMSDVSMPHVSSKLPTARKLFLGQSSMPTAPGDDGSDDEPMPYAPRNRFGFASRSLDPIKTEEPNPPQSFTALSNSAKIMKTIDLTLSSDDNVINLITPKKKATMIRLINRNSPVNLVSDSDDVNQPPDPANLPALADVAIIARYSHQTWIKLSDRERLLISVLSGMPVRTRNSVLALTSTSQEELWRNMIEVMSNIRKGKTSVKGMDDASFEVKSLTHMQQ